MNDDLNGAINSGIDKVNQDLPMMLSDSDQTNENSFLTTLNDSEHLTDFLATINDQSKKYDHS